MKRKKQNTSKPGDHLPERILADLLDLRDESDIAATIARRQNHLTPEAGRIVIAQSLGIAMLLIQQIRERSGTGAQIIQEVRDGLTTDLVAGTLPPEGR